MKATYIQPGDTLDYTNPTESTIEAGTLIVFPRGAAIAACDIAPGETGSATLKGVFEMEKAASAISLGAAVYYDATNDVATPTSTSNAYIGVAAAAADADATTVKVRLN